MHRMPPPPELPLSQRASGRVRLRYEDITQDGQLLPTAMPAALGEVFWQQAMQQGGLGAQLAGSGVVPILTRLCCVPKQGPISVFHPLTAHCRYDMAQQRDANGEVSRLLLRVWLDLRAPRARTYNPPPADAGEVIAAAALYAEHVFTRPFAAAGQRRVIRLPPGRWPEVPSQRVEWVAPKGLCRAAEFARPLEDWRQGSEPLVFGLGDTDANRHVNSLVYLRVFYTAALRAIARHQPVAGLSLRYHELRFRKPCFAGEEMSVRLRCYRDGEEWTVHAMLLPTDAQDDSRGQVYAQLRLVDRGSEK